MSDLSVRDAGTGRSGFVRETAKVETSFHGDQRFYWCLVEGKEYGPVDRQKLLDWIDARRLHRKDQVRVARGPFVVADSIPGLFPPRSTASVIEATSKSDSKSMIETNVEISTSTPTQSMDIPRFKRTVHTGSNSFAAGSAIERAPATKDAFARANPVSIAVSRDAFSMGVRLPTAPVRRPSPKSAGSAGVNDLLTAKPTLAAGGTLLFGLLFYFIFPFLPFGESSTVQRFKELQGAYFELIRLRADDNPQIESFQPLGPKIESVAKKVAEQIKGSKDPEQRKVLAIALKMEELSKEKLGMKPTETELIVSKAIVETAKKLGTM